MKQRTCSFTLFILKSPSTVSTFNIYTHPLLQTNMNCMTIKYVVYIVTLNTCFVGLTQQSKYLTQLAQTKTEKRKFIQPQNICGLHSRAICALVVLHTGLVTLHMHAQGLNNQSVQFVSHKTALYTSDLCLYQSQVTCQLKIYFPSQAGSSIHVTI